MKENKNFPLLCFGTKIHPLSQPRAALDHAQLRAITTLPFPPFLAQRSREPHSTSAQYAFWPSSAPFSRRPETLSRPVFSLAQ